MIIHDDTLCRTSDISKIKKFSNHKPWRVCDFTLEELQSLDFGSWFNQKIVENLREAGFFVNVFTVNKSKQKNKFFDWGVNGIFTDLIPLWV